jgi:hypothetical protein
MNAPHCLSSTNEGQCWEIRARMDCVRYEFSQGPALTPNLFSLFSECPGLCSPPQLCVSLHEGKAQILIPLVEITVSVGSQSCPSCNASLPSLDRSPFFLPKSTSFLAQPSHNQCKSIHTYRRPGGCQLYYSTSLNFQEADSQMGMSYGREGWFVCTVPSILF